MKAIVHDTYGSPDVLQVREIEQPVIGEDEVLVRVRAASVNPFDWHLMRGEPYISRLMGTGFRGPRMHNRGVDMAGVVEAVGRDVNELQPGDEVFGGRAGAFAEYLRGKPQKFVLKPAGITFEQAAAMPIAGCTALQAVRDHGQLQPGQRVLVNGAAGGVGTFAVQVAREFGGHVTGVCSTRNVEMVRSIGADQVVDYTRQDFLRDGPYDLIVDIIGNRSLRKLRRALTPTGRLVIVGGQSGRWLRPMPRIIRAMVLSRFLDKRLVTFFADMSQEHLRTLADLAEAGKITSVIDRTYPLRETPEAIRYLETGHARGKVVITV